MTARDLAELIGRTGTAFLRASGGGAALRVDIRVIDAKTAFGRTDVLIEPIAGSGELWVSIDNVTLSETES